MKSSAYLVELLLFDVVIGDYMAEAMTVETIIQAYWDIKGYWTKLRVPIKVGGWTDIDVVAYNPLKKELVLAESKVRGNKHALKVYTNEFHAHSENNSFLSFDKLYGKDGKYDYLSFIERLDAKFMDSIFKELSLPKENIETISFHLVSNYYIEENLLESAQNEVKDEMNKLLDGSGYSIHEVIIQTTFDVLCEIISKEEMNEQGRRYGHPVLDIAREINRYMHPDVRLINSRKIAYNKDCKEEIQKNLQDKILKSFGVV